MNGIDELAGDSEEEVTFIAEALVSDAPADGVVGTEAEGVHDAGGTKLCLRLVERPSNQLMSSHIP